MKYDVTMAELNKSIKQLKKKFPGPYNEMLQHLGNTPKQKLLDICNLSWRFWTGTSVLEGSHNGLSFKKKRRTEQSQQVTDLST
jgi:hypothetical protein